MAGLADRARTGVQQSALKDRKAWIFHGALSPTGASQALQVTDTEDGLSRYSDREFACGPDLWGGSKFAVRAESLQTLLQCITSLVRAVDSWSLDVEGSEGTVLEHTDFSQVEIKALMVETNKEEENNARIRAVLKRHGYQELGWTRGCSGEQLDESSRSLPTSRREVFRCPLVS